MANYAEHVSTRKTPQSEAIPGKKQAQNQAGGFSFEVDCWTKLDRFLILGNEGGSYYANEKQMTIQNSQAISDCHAIDPKRTIDRIVEVSDKGLAPKNDPAIFALAQLSKDPYALAQVNKVCRIGTHLFQFIEAAKHFRGRGRAFNTALKHWYLDKEPRQLAYQMVKYQQRNGMSHRDVLRLCKPKTKRPGMNWAFRWAVGKADSNIPVGDGSPLIPIIAFEQAQRATNKGEVASLIRNFDLVRECIPTQFLNEPEVWEALLEKMPLTAMIRNLGKMTSIGLTKPLSQASKMVCDRLQDTESLKKARVHPIALLLAQNLYKVGHGLKGSLTWSPDNRIIDALDDAFYRAFDFVEPTGKRHLLALDVSGSMSSGHIAGTYLTPREASAAMAMLSVKTEPVTHAVGFTGGAGRWAGYPGLGGVRQSDEPLTELAFSKNMRLSDAVKLVSNLPFGGTDCALPMIYALERKLEVDVFVVITDNETWAGDIHPCQALVRYREKMGIPAKLIVMGMEANSFSIADPNDAGMLDVCGFSADVPQVMNQFILG